MKKAAPEGSNGIEPIYCSHESLCKTVSGLYSEKKHGLLDGHHLIQIGHWTSCNFVHKDILTFGNPYVKHALFTIQYIIATELVPGSLEQLVSFYDYTPHTQRHQRNYLVFDSVKLKPNMEHKTAKIVPDTFFMFKPKQYFVQQKPSSGNYKIAWHILVSDFTLKNCNEVKPSFFFQMRTKEYWSLNVHDTFCPTNTIERNMPKQDLCIRCSNALDSNSIDLLDCETEAETESTSENMKPLEISESSKRSEVTADPFTVMSLNDFFK